MENERQDTGIKCIDLLDQNMTSKYMPHPATNPLEVYVAKLKDFGDRETAVDEVYRLLTRENPKVPNKREHARTKDGRNLAVVVKQKEIVDTMRKHYETVFDDDSDENYYDGYY